MISVPFRSAIDELWMARQYLDDLGDEVRSISEQIDLNGESADTEVGDIELEKAQERIANLLADIRSAEENLEKALESVKMGRRGW